MIGLLLLFSASAIFAFGHECRIRKFPSGTVCVCNSTHCDTVPSINVSHGKYQVYSTSKSKPGFYCEIGSFINNTTVAANEITVNPSVKYQTIIGFGGAFTDSTGININSLPAAAQKKLIESYFSENGIEYNLCRVPLAGTDFSTRAYSYDDVPLDTNLSKFSLQPEDFNYKVSKLF
ncbi:hypothetical protein NQ314_009753 [Rhamnusium bicolor]|uniref:Glucosylceramidase n=1 Tax=Rhamnusium bicolor TaxID=1586634 RepID=A0AAV8XWZ6_9CUCU|nr:hypothetical protein NQ314_009753 [Rhamnusium bicolor]